MSDDFFGDLGKSISRATQNAVDKTSNFFESTKISAQISAEQKEIEKLYIRIGESIARKVEAGNKDYVGEKELGYVDDVHAHLNRILELKQELAGVKGMKICPNCQKLVDVNAAFCPKCGAPMPVEEEKEEKSGTGAGEASSDTAGPESVSREEEEIPDASFDTVEDLSGIADEVMDAGFTTIDDRTGDADDGRECETVAEAGFVVLEENGNDAHDRKTENGETAKPNPENQKDGAEAESQKDGAEAESQKGGAGAESAGSGKKEEAAASKNS